ncbi:MAG TPA: glycerol-3-phosphate dehydrogenase [Hellea balneolensis]|uniref:Glycerol-3-phosphate dehydrogenase n=1 Tax=Hellea balneolensis TaxID=287478 RepID=A0A7C3C5Z0_9PROT|nr:glycerol-3-phosphate dehydrogenase [Hellea balneolensis]
MATQIYDLFIIGGGINGTGIARDAAGRGLSVLLCEKNDLASGTSSKSSKLIHGGLRYLEYGEFRLVREALKERETLLRAAPHLVRSVRIVLPHHSSLRPKWMLRLGLFIYDHLGGRKSLPGTSVANLTTGARKDVLKANFKTGFVFSDCWVDDARLVVTNALGARDHGAQIITRTKCVGLSHTNGIWTAELYDRLSKKTKKIQAKCIVNAAGIRVDDLVELALGREHEDHLRLVKGSHIVVKKLYEGRHLYMFQNPDGRIIFAIPYEGAYTLIGTTDEPYKISDGPIKISQKETDYLIKTANDYFKAPVREDDIVWTYAGVRPLYDNKKQSASAVTRDYVFDLKDDDTPPILSIFGGKITTYRELSEHALKKLRAHFPDLAKRWTAKAPLPGGDLQDADFDAFLSAQREKYPWLSRPLSRRLARAYGSNMDAVIGTAKSMKGMGKHFGGGLTAREAKYLTQHEWARTANDILWRRTKCGLHMSKAECAAFAAWFAAQFP